MRDEKGAATEYPKHWDKAFNSLAERHSTYRRPAKSIDWRLGKAFNGIKPGKEEISRIAEVRCLAKFSLVFGLLDSSGSRIMPGITFQPR
jgi:hypothetical protein